jgi:hypothetical protein
MKRNDELRMEVGELRESAESAARETSDMLARAQEQNYERDARTYRKINALVLEKIFSFILLSDKEFSLNFISLHVRDQSRQQVYEQPGTGNSNSHATAYTRRDPQATTSTTLEQQHDIHVHCGAPCRSGNRSTEVEDHKVLCPPDQTHVHIG